MDLTTCVAIFLPIVCIAANRRIKAHSKRTVK